MWFIRFHRLVWHLRMPHSQIINAQHTYVYHYHWALNQYMFADPWKPYSHRPQFDSILIWVNNSLAVYQELKSIYWHHWLPVYNSGSKQELMLVNRMIEGHYLHFSILPNLSRLLHRSTVQDSQISMPWNNRHKQHNYYWVISNVWYIDQEFVLDVRGLGNFQFLMDVSKIISGRIQQGRDTPQAYFHI